MLLLLVGFLLLFFGGLWVYYNRSFCTIWTAKQTKITLKCSSVALYITKNHTIQQQQHKQNNETHSTSTKVNSRKEHIWTNTRQQLISCFYLMHFIIASRWPMSRLVLSPFVVSSVLPFFRCFARFFGWIMGRLAGSIDRRRCTHRMQFSSQQAGRQANASNFPLCFSQIIWEFDKNKTKFNEKPKKQNTKISLTYKMWDKRDEMKTKTRYEIQLIKLLIEIARN